MEYQKAEINPMNMRLRIVIRQIKCIINDSYSFLGIARKK